MKVLELRRIAPLSQHIRFLMLLAMFFVPNVVSAQTPPAGPFAYVTNQSSDTVTVIDTSTNLSVATITLCTGCTPAGLAVTADGRFVYVANQGNGTVNGSVSVIATSTNTVATTISLNCDCSAPSAVGVAITPDGLHAYVTDKGQGSVHVIDTSTNLQTTRITASTIIHPFSIAITPDGAYVYATEFSTTATTNVNMISTATNAVVASIAVGNNPSGVAVSPDGRSVYATNNASNTVSVFGAGNLTPTITTITVGSGPYSVAFTPDGAFAYVVNRGSDTVSVINTATQSVVGAPIRPDCVFSGQIAITPNGTEAYVADDECSQVDVITTASNTSTTHVSVGSSPFGVAIGPAPSGAQPPQSAGLSSAGGSFNFGWPIGCNPNQTPNTCDYTFGVTYPAGMFQDGSTATVTPNEITQAEWAQRTPEGNPYSGTDIAQVLGKGGKGVVFSADCSGPCASPTSSTKSYNIKTTWKSAQTNYCGSGPGLLDADPIGSNNWVNTLINCTQISSDPVYGTGGTHKCTAGTKCLSDWANVFNIGGPIASASPFLVDFGNVELWHFGFKFITLTNIGNSPLSISSVKVASASGGDSDDFHAVSLCFQPLGVGKSCFIFVAFFADRDQFGPQSATLTITDTANGSPHLVLLTATVVKED
jgi:YVTN family beta-propeller protein